MVLFLLAIMFGHRQLDPAELIAVMTIAMSVGLLAQIIAIARVLPDFRGTAVRSEPSRWRSSALHFWVASILEAANQYFDVILVYWMLDPATAGIYFAASRPPTSSPCCRPHCTALAHVGSPRCTSARTIRNSSERCGSWRK